MDSETLKFNYRPISVLPAGSKMAERIVFDQLYEFSLNFLSNSTHPDFWKDILKTCEDIKKNLDSKDQP